MNRPLIVIDFESGGIESHRPSIQLGAVAVENGEELSTFLAYFNFDESLADPAALEMNGYDPDVWRELGEYEDSVAERFTDFLRPYACLPMTSKRTGNEFKVARIACYSGILFDMPRLNRLFENRFKPFTLAPLDVRQQLIWYYETFPEVIKPANHKLETVCKFWQIPHSPHNALSDARATAILSYRIMQATREAAYA